MSNWLSISMTLQKLQIWKCKYVSTILIQFRHTLFTFNKLLHNSVNQDWGQFCLFVLLCITRIQTFYLFQHYILLKSWLPSYSLCWDFNLEAAATSRNQTTSPWVGRTMAAGNGLSPLPSRTFWINTYTHACINTYMCLCFYQVHLKFCMQYLNKTNYRLNYFYTAISTLPMVNMSTSTIFVKIVKLEL